MRESQKGEKKDEPIKRSDARARQSGRTLICRKRKKRESLARRQNISTKKNVSPNEGGKKYGGGTRGKLAEISLNERAPSKLERLALNRGEETVWVQGQPSARGIGSASVPWSLCTRNGFLNKGGKELHGNLMRTIST